MKDPSSSPERGEKPSGWNNSSLLTAHYSLKKNFLLKERGKSLVEFVRIGETAIDDADGFDLGTNHDFVVALAEDVLHENVLDTVFLYPEFGDEFVATLERNLELHGESSHHTVDASLMKFGEADVVGKEKFVTCVFDVVLIVGVVDNALEVAFVVAHLHFEFVDVIGHEKYF